jgi:tetratricopeptide (TPR) repeat protein
MCLAFSLYGFSMASRIGKRIILRPRLALGCSFIVLAGFALAQSSETTSIERYAQVGQRALAEGNYPAAEQAFEKLRELEPGVAEVHANLGLIYFQQRKYDAAVPALRKALKLKPSLQKTDMLLAISLSELGRYDEALPGLEKNFRRSTDPEAKRMCGLQLERAYTGLQRDNKAVEVALELNRLFPNDPEILYHNGKIFGNFAFLDMQKLVRVAPTSVWRHLAAAEAQESQGAYAPAIAEYERVLELDPRRPGVHYRLGRTLLQRSHDANSPNDIAEATKQFEQELQLDPSNASAAYELGEINLKAAQLGNAQKFFELALKNYPDFEEAHVGLAATLVTLQQPEQALPHLQKAITANPQDEAAWYRLFQVQRSLGNAAEEQKALAEFKLLHQKSVQQNGLEPVFSPREVTKQEVQPEAAQ